MGLFDFFRGHPDKDRFAEIFIRAARKAGLAGHLEYDRASFAVVRGAETSFLGNAYADYCKAPRGRRADVLRSYLAAALEPDDDLGLAESRSHVLPCVRPLLDFALGGLAVQLRGQPLEQLVQPWTEDLGVAVVRDSEHALRYLTGSQLEQWEISFDEALAIGIDNLRARSEPRFTRVAPGLLASDWHDAYDSTRMLLPELFHPLGLSGAPIVMIPDRDTLLVAGDADAGSLAAMLARARKALETTSRPLSASMYRLAGDAWSAFRPADATGEALDAAVRDKLAVDYSEQKHLLEQVHAQRGEDLFVATLLRVRKNDTGRIASMATWSEGVLALLPRADHVAFTRPAAGADSTDSFIVRWDDVVAIVGDHLVPQGMHPERYRVSRFPDAAQLAALRARAS